MIELREMIIVVKSIFGVLKNDEENQFTIFLKEYDKPIYFNYETEEDYKRDLNKLLTEMGKING